MARPALRYLSPFVTRGGYFQYFFTDFKISTKMIKFQGILKNSHYRGPASSKILTTGARPVPKFSLQGLGLFQNSHYRVLFEAWGACQLKNISAPNHESIAGKAFGEKSFQLHAPGLNTLVLLSLETANFNTF